MKAVVFDFDGVIADSEPVHEEAIRVALGRLGMGLTHEEFLRHCLGVGDRLCLRNVAAAQGRAVTDAMLDGLMEVKHAEFLRLVGGGRVKGYPATAELMRRAGAAGPVGLCSGSLRRSVEPVLRRLGLLECLGAVVTADDVPKPKPDPAGYLLAAERLGAAPADCVAIEDTPTGIAAALAAGLRVAAVCHSLPAERLAGAHRIFESTARIRLEDLRAL